MRRGTKGPEIGPAAAGAGSDPEARSVGTKGTARVLIILLLDPIADLTLGGAAGPGNGPRPDRLSRRKKLSRGRFFCLTLPRGG